MRILMISILCAFIFLSCKNETQDQNNAMTTDTVSEQVLSNKKNDIMTNNEQQPLEFTDVFNLIPIIRFTPEDLKTTDDPKILEFRKKLKIFEDYDPMINGISSDDLILLVNNETFF